jgi:hypothetical protein
MAVIPDTVDANASLAVDEYSIPGYRVQLGEHLLPG